MAERMGGITRIVDRNYVHPDLLKSRLQEQREREAGGSEKEPKERVKFSKLQLAIINECVKNGREHGSYTASLDGVVDEYYGKKSGMRIGKMVAVRRATRTLGKKGLARLMPGLVARVELTPRAIKIAKETEE